MNNIKRFLIGTAAGATLLANSILPAGAAPTVFTRALPTENLNNDAGSIRSNVAWSNENEYVSGDDFTIGNPGEQWVITGIRTWNIGHLGNAFGDEFSDTTLYFGTGAISEVAHDTVASGSNIGDNLNITHTPVTYANESDYQAQGGDYRQIWQNDYTNLSIPINGGEKYYFAVDGTAANYLWFNHASNEALSGSTQDGSDGKWVAWSKSDLSTPNICDSNEPIGGTCDGGWDKSSDINVQVFATQVEPNSGEITNPATDGDHVNGTVNFTATYTDGDGAYDDAVQWAIRQGTCAAGTGTVLGNVDGHNDVEEWDGASFSFETNVDLLAPGNYCFVFNPTDDAGENDVSVTREFVIENPFAVPAECSEIDGLGAPIVGTNGSNVINGTNGNDLIFALGGSDKVDGRRGDDCIVGGDGSDKLIGGNGNDVILGEKGSDSIEGNNHNDTLYGGDGSDSLRGGNQDDTLYGGDDSDSLRGENGVDTLNGDNGSDSLRGGNGNDTLTGGAGVDSARGESGNNDVCDAESENTCEA